MIGCIESSKLALVTSALATVFLFLVPATSATAQIETEIVAMDLVGADPFFGIGPIRIGVEGPGNPSRGQVASASGGPSYFDVNPKITIDDWGPISQGGFPAHLAEDG